MTDTIASRVLARGQADAGGVAMRVKRLGIWQEVTWGTYAEEVAQVAKGLLALGVAPADRVAIVAENRPEWLYADAGIVAARGVSVGIDPALDASGVAAIVAGAGVRVAIAEDQEQVDKLLGTDVEHIVYLLPRGVGDYEDTRLMPWASLREQAGGDQPGGDAGDDAPVTIFYDGDGAMPMTAAEVNAVTDDVVAGELFGDGISGSDLLLSFLTLAGRNERAASVWLHAASGPVLHFYDSVETVQIGLREVQPTLVLGTPTMWRTLRASVESGVAGASRLKAANARYWLGAAEKMATARADNGGEHTSATRLRYAVGYPLFFRPVLDQLGLRRCRRASSGTAPLDADLAAWWLGLGIPIRDVDREA